MLLQPFPVILRALLAGMIVLGCAPSPSVEVDDPAAKAMPCVYLARETPEDPYPELQPHEGCATISDSGEVTILPQHLAAIDFDDRPYVAIHAADSWRYVMPSGKNVAVVAFDNGADSFEEGLARTRIDGRIAYVNETFEVVIPPRYERGWPFSNGRALVCSGCVVEDSDDEHKPVVGGVWGFIDRDGREVVPVELTREEAFSERYRSFRP